MEAGVQPGPVPGVPAASAENDNGRPTLAAVLVSSACLVASLLVVALVNSKGDGFTPRVETLDALAGLSIGAFIVDRLLTFVPPGFFAAKAPKQREADLGMLRIGYGAVLGAVFVMLTDLRAVQALTPENSTEIGEGLDRAIAVLAIAGGVAGLARLLSGINPQPATDATEPLNAPEPGTIPPPSHGARIIGVVGVLIGAALALFAIGDKNGVELVGPDPKADGTVGLIVRFGLVFLAAGIVQQLAEFAGRAVAPAKNDKPLILGGLAVVLGIAAARVFDLYLLHNIGFFGVAPGASLNVALDQSSGLELWGDAFLTGLIIASGTKPLHDVASRLRRAKKRPEGRAGS